MKIVCIGLLAGAVGCALVLQFPPAAAARAKETIIHSFGSGSDGSEPEAGLIDVKGTLYGSTRAGGNSGGGAVIALDPNTGAEKVLYSFCSQQSCTDGEFPEAGLLDVKGTLYSTTQWGGAHGSGSGGGTVFSIDPETGAETAVYSFCSQANCVDGSLPEAGVIDVNGTLYGTTGSGGAYCVTISTCGTLFALDPQSGAETVLHSFGAFADGVGPSAGLIDVNGMLYGTTTGGGTYGGGAVFAFDLNTREESVLFSFCSDYPACTDGFFPEAGLIDVNGTLYGTTQFGGSKNQGMVFALDPNTGAETVLYSFCGKQGCSDGREPQASLTGVKGRLYGTTPLGGAHGQGAVFALDPDTGAERMVYSFCSQQNCTNGAVPEANLIDMNGTLYGTTSDGGTYNAGTAFALKKR